MYSIVRYLGTRLCNSFYLSYVQVKFCWANQVNAYWSPFNWLPFNWSPFIWSSFIWLLLNELNILKCELKWIAWFYWDCKTIKLFDCETYAKTEEHTISDHTEGQMVADGSSHYHNCQLQGKVIALLWFITPTLWLLAFHNDNNNLVFLNCFSPNKPIWLTTIQRTLGPTTLKLSG